MEMIEVVIKIPQKVYEDCIMIPSDIKDWKDEISKAFENGIPLPENHGKIVDLGKIDEDRIDKDNPIITISINGSEIEAVSLDYLNSLPDLTKKEE